ncbi:aminopeptidase P family protein [Staphylococcus massiliensis]|uniref:M24 family metallopeptidase n=1 Tax=Staphylococcus massiliensis TaxID=555791 RepID=UPI001EDDD54D|nr:aminopeptidase P family protein [Staphylococcus massiliensis]MCG3401033.1 aminopeptidase P family protein [Staphylococcus massiliensis]
MNKLENVKNILKEKDLDALIILSDFNRRYVSNFTGTSGALLITSKESILVTDFRYIEQANEQAKGFEIVKQTKDLIATVGELIESKGLKEIGFEGPHVPYDTYEALNAFDFNLTSVNFDIDKIRQVKTQEEIEIIQHAAKIVDDAYEYILTVVKPGMTEKEVKAYLESKMLHLGADDTSFDTIVASGYCGALPHGVASDKVIEKGDMITLDFGAYYQGYASDITRTFAVGDPDPKMKEIYNIVLKAQEEAVKQAKAGMGCKELDAVARDIITEAGYGDNFGHSLGHGIGLDVHEAPVLSFKSDAALKVNQCVTIEPGIYVEGLGGVRIEDDILITEDGCQRFTNSSKELIIL